MRRAVSFLTPFGGAAAPAPSALAWFPPVGAIIGLAVGGVWWAAQRAWPPAAAAALAVIADAALTGMLHLDGFADAADGLLPPLPRARRLEVMADPRLGAFGGVALAVVLLTRFAAFASMAPGVLAVAGLWCGSRTAMAVTVLSVPYARPGGLASAFLRSPGAGTAPAGAGSAGGPEAAGAGRRAAALAAGPAAIGLMGGPAAIGLMGGPAAIGLMGGLLALGLAVAGRGIPGAAAVGVEAAAAAAVVSLARRRLGGFTGDILGAAAVAGETAGLLTLAARW